MLEDSLIILVFVFVGLAAGAVLALFSARVHRARLLQHAESEAARLLAEAKDEAEHAMDEAKLAAQEIEDEIWARNEKEISEIEARVKNRDEEFRKKRSLTDRTYNQDTREVQKQLDVILENESLMQKRQEQYSQRKANIQRLRERLLEELKQVAGIEPEDLKRQLAGLVEQEIQIEAKRKAGLYEDDVRAQSEEIAKKTLGNALSRFPRAACTERGIGVVEIPNDDVKRRMLGPEGANLALIQQLCGAELTITEANTFQIASYDPIRREVTTRLLEKLLHERSPSADTIQRLHEKTMRDVARKVEADGNRIAAELNQKDLHPEIKKMLGTLRYRYSFAQNQHFHVGEVGWLCGLLASELGIEITSAKRSGLLHDVGKAMDHSIDGGHAVIGADFIDKHGEKPHVVHAVRAHHYEEQPSTDLAFLVIAADAMSGARPGARRATVNLYNQKIEALNNIADSFRGVTKTLILNAGREVRVLVDGRRVGDEASLKLCRDIANKIEDECQYPGQIKVVVIRETHAEAMAK